MQEIVFQNNISYTIEKRISKNNKEYYCAILTFCDGVKKIIFLTYPEVKLIELS